VKPDEVEAFLASTFGGKARTVSMQPEALLLISNRSGVNGLGEAYKERLVAMGTPEAQIVVRNASPDSLPSRVATETSNWEHGEYYSSLLNIERQQVYRIEAQGVKVGLELILGTDAFDTVSTVKVLPRDESLTAEEADSEYLD
jgi:hypothetical protein